MAIASVLLMSEAQKGGIVFWLMGMLVSACWGLAGRWIFFIPTEFFLAGYLQAETASGRRLRVSNPVFSVCLWFSLARLGLFSMSDLCCISPIGSGSQ